MFGLTSGGAAAAAAAAAPAAPSSPSRSSTSIACAASAPALRSASISARSRAMRSSFSRRRRSETSGDDSKSASRWLRIPAVLRSAASSVRSQKSPARMAARRRSSSTSSSVSAFSATMSSSSASSVSAAAVAALRAAVASALAASPTVVECCHARTTSRTRLRRFANTCGGVLMGTTVGNCDSMMLRRMTCGALTKSSSSSSACSRAWFKLASPVLCMPITTHMFLLEMASTLSRASSGTFAERIICRKNLWCWPQNCASFIAGLRSPA
mmetsp:Transcript_24309/g.79299  ORF Transcript_24309/g.79299 Transcript_24309/m.79299 type:complete len:270 (-) Transcript_24309:1551-2360(-)